MNTAPIAGVDCRPFFVAVSICLGLSVARAAEEHPPTDEREPQTRMDAFGDPLPAGAIARLGTVRFRHGGGIAFVAFTPDGKRPISQGNDGVRVWEIAPGKELWHAAAVPGHARRTVDLSPDGARIAISAHGASEAIRFRDAKMGEKAGSLGDNSRSLVRFSPDGKLLAAYRKVLKGKPSLEARRRIEELVEKAQMA